MVFTDRLTAFVGSVLMIIWALILFHAPLTVGFGVWLPDFSEVVKSWKEILLGVVLIPALWLGWRTELIKLLLDDWLFRLIIAYAGLHVVLFFTISNSLEAKLAGILIDIRYLLFFVLLYGLLMLKPHWKPVFLKVGIVVTAISLLFSFLQATILPRDILAYIGYEKSTIAPYLTVDNNNDFVRVNGTFRGPNPLGAFTGVILLLVIGYIFKQTKQSKKHKYILLFFAIAAAASLWASFSRSAVLGVLAGVLVLLLVLYGKNLALKHWLVAGVSFIIVCSTIFLLRDSSFIQNVILHDNPKGGSAVSSNDDHLKSLESGTQRLFRQPLGAGIGSTGSASLRSDAPFILENQYLFIAHESGWLGLGLFIAIFGMILQRLYDARKNWLALGVFASGVSLTVVGLFLPVFADDMVGIVWFGLAALALASQINLRKGNHAKKTNKKTI